MALFINSFAIEKDSFQLFMFYILFYFENQANKLIITRTL